MSPLILADRAVWCHSGAWEVSPRGSSTASATAYTLDPTSARIAKAVATNGTTTSTTVNDYADNGDSPAWSTLNGTWTREVGGPGGMLDATVTQSGAVTLDLVNLQGSEVATAADSTADTGIDSSSYATYNEYGTPTNGAASAATYGWLGGNERSADSLGGLILMGARLYNNATGRFLSADAGYGGNANPYIYPTDPINSQDLAGASAKGKGGRAFWSWVARGLTWIGSALDMASWWVCLTGVWSCLAVKVLAFIFGVAATLIGCIQEGFSVGCIMGIIGVGLGAVGVPIAIRAAIKGPIERTVVAILEAISGGFGTPAGLFGSALALGQSFGRKGGHH
jgi:RHS repeat-associated protein